MSKNYSYLLKRPLTQEELDELERQREACCNLAVEGVIVTQRTTAGDEIDLTKYLASRYVKEAFNDGWDKRVSENQCLRYKPKSPTNKIYRNSIGVKMAKWVIPAAIIATIISIAAPPAIPIALVFVGIAATIGLVAGVVDGYLENKTIQRVTTLGEKSAEKEITGIINQKEKRDSLKKEIKDELAQEKIAEQSKNGNSIIPQNATQLSPSGNEMTKTA